MSNILKTLKFSVLIIIINCSLDAAKSETCEHLIRTCSYSGCSQLKHDAGIEKCRHQCRASAPYPNACWSGCRQMKQLNPNACEGSCGTHFPAHLNLPDLPELKCTD